MELLASPIRAYTWGSRTVIAAMQGRSAPTPQPEAELWMGAHPDSPSTIGGGAQTLTDAVAADPDGLLGAATVARFGPRLPFMLKVLAAESPLSLQAHPDGAYAARRYADEATLPRAERLYTDPYAKPELLVAVDDFDTLCGFRDPAISAQAIEDLAVPQLVPIVALLRSGTVTAQLRDAVSTLLRWPVEGRATVVEAVVAAAARRGPDYVVDLGSRFPADMGVVVALLLNHVRLGPGEAIWMPAGNLHAYLRGAGMELLASSDNVLRGGLTAKRVDIDELVRVLRYEVLTDPVVKPVAEAPGVLTWPVPAAEFSLLRIDPSGSVPVEIDAAGPRIVFCQRGLLELDDGSTPRLRLSAGQAAFGRAGRRLRVSGDGVLFAATTGA